MLIMGVMEVIGIASILPFMALLAEPEVIDTNIWLSWAYEYFAFESHRSMLLAAGLLVIGIIAVTNIASIAIMWLKYSYTWNMAHNLGIRLLNTYLKKPYRFYLTTNTSDLKTYLFSEVGALTTGVLIPMIELISKILVSLFIFGLLVAVNPKIATIILLVLGGAYALIYLSRQRLLKRFGQKRIEASVKRYMSLDELLTGIKTIRVYGIERFFYERYFNSSKVFYDIQPRVQIISSAPMYALQIFAFGGILAVTLYLYNTMGDIQSILPILSLYAFAGYRLLPALQAGFASAAKLRHSYPVLDRLHADLIEGLDAEAPQKAKVKPIPFYQTLNLRNISFRYDNMPQKVLDGLSIEIKKGEVVAFVGSTGSGKTTLIDLIVGLLYVSEGSIEVDGVQLDHASIRNWQRQIAYVPQEVFLFDDTISRNIAIGREDQEIDKELLTRVTKIADIYDFISNELPEGFRTEIGERGVRLSGGQRQRLGLARALYHDPSVLILDEATSALDSITEKGIIDSLKSLPHEMTVILIAHRLSSVRHSDCIYLLEEGNVIGQGSYEMLLESNEVFRTMVELS